MIFFKLFIGIGAITTIFGGEVFADTDVAATLKPDDASAAASIDREIADANNGRQLQRDLGTNRQKLPVLQQNGAFNHNDLASVLSNAKRQEPVSLSFDVEGDQIDCDLTESAVMAAGLKEKFPHIMALVGACQDGSTVTITINSKQRGTFYAAIYKDGVQFYAKSDRGQNDDDDEVLSIFRYSDINFPEGFEWSEEVDNENMPSSEYILSSLQDQTNKVYKFRIAVIATREYSSLHRDPVLDLDCDTVDSVLTEVVRSMAVVNGIYLREIGVMFELIEENDKLICISSDTSDDCNLENDYENRDVILAQAAGFIESRGVESNGYDVGHTFTGGTTNGVARRRSLCHSDFKAMGQTGQKAGEPTYPFDTVFAHELGHQLSARHSHRDCHNVVEEHAVEPGSGTTIMSYAGLCRDKRNNVQTLRSPHFNSFHLEIIREFVESKASDTCGTSENLNTVPPIMNTKATCLVPKGNYVQLSGRVDNIDQIASGSVSVYFAWDRIDPGPKIYLDEDVPRFVPQTPTTRSLKRFLPNLYVLSHGVDTLKEIAPKETVEGDENMKFLFVGRTKYDKDAGPIGNDNFDSTLVGRFGYADMELTYSTDHAPLKFVDVPTELVSSETVEITWTGGTILTAYVEILVAVNTMVKVDEGADVNFDDVVEDLEWTSLGTFQNSDEGASVTIPSISNPENLPLNIMIRSVGDPDDDEGVDDDDCYFFDMKSGLVYATPAPTEAPTNPPTNPPTNLPTNPPTNPPSPSPTKPPTKRPTKAPTKPPTPSPTKAPTDYYNQVYNYNYDRGYNQGYNHNYNQGYDGYLYQGYNQGYNGYHYQGYNQGYNGNQGYSYRQPQPQQGWGNDAWGNGGGGARTGHEASYGDGGSNVGQGGYYYYPYQNPYNGNQGYNSQLQQGYGGVRYGGGQQGNYYNQYNHQRYGGHRNLATESTDKALKNEAEILPKAQRKLLRVSKSSE